MSTVYISGPITGIDDYRERFRRAEERLNAAGLATCNPADTEVDGWTWQDYMKWDIGLLVACDRIHMLRGWRDSKGARLEHYIAHELGMNISHETTERLI